jgi:DNA-binding transcriptional regulator YiaG
MDRGALLTATASVCILMVMATRTVTRNREALLERLETRHSHPSPGERKRIRKAAGVSIRDLAAAVGVSSMAPVRWEQGAYPRDPEHLRVYADLLAEMKRLAPDGNER